MQCLCERGRDLDARFGGVSGLGRVSRVGGLGRVSRVDVAVTCVGARVSAEERVERFVECVFEGDRVTKGHKHLAQQREARLTCRPHVDRLHIQEAAANGQGEQVAQQHFGFTALQQCEVIGHDRVRTELVLHLTRARNRLRGQGEQRELAVILAGVSVGREVARKHVALVLARGARNEGRVEREARCFGAWNLHRQVVGRLQRGGRSERRRVVRRAPLVIGREERARVGHVVGTQDVALNLEQVSRVAHVRQQLLTHLACVNESVGEHLLPRLQNRVFGVPRVERDRTVVGVDRGLHRVANVVDLVQREGRCRRVGVGNGLAQRDGRRVGVARRGRVTVDDPHDATIDDGRVRVRVERQVRRCLLNALDRVAFVQNLRGVRHGLREEDLLRLELDRVEQALEHVVERRAAIAREGVGRVAHLLFTALRGEVELEVVATADDRVRRRELTEVHAGLILAQLGCKRASGRDSALEELRATVVGALVAVGRHDAITVREDNRVVVPVLRGLARGVKLAKRDDRVLRAAVDLVAVNVEELGELVVLAELLELREGV